MVGFPDVIIAIASFMCSIWKAPSDTSYLINNSFIQIVSTFRPSSEMSKQIIKIIKYF
jgi:hypothetical protein